LYTERDNTNCSKIPSFLTSSFLLLPEWPFGTLFHCLKLDPVLCISV